MTNLKLVPHSTRLIRLTILSALTIGCWLSNPYFTSAQSNGVTYHNPLAYVGADGNYYVTSLDGISTAAITSQMEIEPAEFPEDTNYYGSRPHWSPLGSQFAFINKNSLYIAASGKQIELILSNVDFYSMSSLVWSPNGNQLAYREGYDVQIIKPDGTRVTSIEIERRPTVGGGGGGSGTGPGPERAQRILREDRDQTTFGSLKGRFFLLSDSGYVTRLPEDSIVSPDGTRILTTEYVYMPFEVDDGYYTVRPILNEIITGNFLPLPSSMGIGSEPLAWTPDGTTIIYATQALNKKIGSVENCSTLSECQDHYDYILTLWRQSFDEEHPTKLFEHKGYAFGTATVSPDNTTVVVSLITNTFFDKVNPDVQIIAVPMNGGQAQWIAVGGKPAFGKGDFTAIPASAESTVQAQQCPKSLVSRLKIGQRAKVTPGAPNVLRARPAAGTDLEIMKAGSVFLVLNGPRCGSDGLAWWKVNYRGEVGWTAESDSKSYWLEQ